MCECFCDEPAKAKQPSNLPRSPPTPPSCRTSSTGSSAASLRVEGQEERCPPATAKHRELCAQQDIEPPHETSTACSMEFWTSSLQVSASRRAPRANGAPRKGARCTQTLRPRCSLLGAVCAWLVRVVVRVDVVPLRIVDGTRHGCGSSSAVRACCEPDPLPQGRSNQPRHIHVQHKRNASNRKAGQLSQDQGNPNKQLSTRTQSTTGRQPGMQQAVNRP